MGIGSSGRITTFAVIALLSGAALAGWISIRALGAPETPLAPLPGTEERQPRRTDATKGSTETEARAPSGRGQFTLLERDVNAFIAAYLAARRDTPLAEVHVRLVGDGIVEVSGGTRLGRILGGESAARLAQYLPGRWLGRTVWLRARGPLRLEVDASRHQQRALRLEVERAFVGRQRVPVAVFDALCGFLLRLEASQLLRWSLPASVETVTVEPGRALIRTGWSRQRSGVADHR